MQVDLFDSDNINQNTEFLSAMSLTDVQQEAVQHIDGPLLVIAGAGSGKTRVITSRIAWMIEQGVPAEQIMAITFTNKAAGEMKERIIRMLPSANVLASTFHSFCARVLRQDIVHLGYSQSFSIYDRADQKSIAKTAIKEIGLDTTHYSVAKVLYYISNAKNDMVSPQSFESGTSSVEEQNIARVYYAYEELLRANNALDFDDLLRCTAELFDGFPDVLEYYQDRYRYILMDEYQDTNAAQYRIVTSLAKKYRNICVTGDPDQSIYAWRGANIQIINNFSKDYADALVLKMEQNFRSTQTILNVANAVIKNNVNRSEKMLWTESEKGDAVELIKCDTAYNEARAIVAKMKQAHQAGEQYSTMAAFYRVNALSRHLEMAMLDAEIPYGIVGGLPFFDRKEIKDLVCYLRLLVNPDDGASVERIINVPARGIGKTSVDRLKAFARQQRISLGQAVKRVDEVDTLRARAKNKIAQFSDLLDRIGEVGTRSVEACLQTIIAETDFENFLEETQKIDEDRVANVQQMVAAGSEYDESTENSSLLDFLEKVALISDVDEWNDQDDTVTLMTLHASKGLEFDSVYIVGVEQGLLPHSRALDDESEMEEERRLFYVGITRCKKKLHLSLSMFRDLWGQNMRTLDSCFLAEIPEKLLQVTDKMSPFHSNLNRLRQSVQDDFDKDVDQGGFYDEEAETESYQKGEIVRHKIFGHGEVLETSGYGKNVKVKVHFSNGEIKSLILAYAKLERINS